MITPPAAKSKPPNTAWVTSGAVVLALACIVVTSIMWSELVPLYVREEIEFGLQGFLEF